MGDSKDREAQIADTDAYLKRMYPLVESAISNVLSSVKGERVGVVTPAWIQMLVEVAFEFSRLGGMGPGDFSDSLRFLAQYYEDTYGANRKGTLEVTVNGRTFLSSDGPTGDPKAN